MGSGFAAASLRMLRQCPQLLQLRPSCCGAVMSLMRQNQTFASSSSKRMSGSPSRACGSSPALVAPSITAGTAMNQHKDANFNHQQAKQEHQLPGVDHQPGPIAGQDAYDTSTSEDQRHPPVHVPGARTQNKVQHGARSDCHCACSNRDVC